jgi:hypothetical protein
MKIISSDLTENNTSWIKNKNDFMYFLWLLIFNYALFNLFTYIFIINKNLSN